MPVTLTGSGDKAMNKASKNPQPRGAYVLLANSQVNRSNTLLSDGDQGCEEKQQEREEGIGNLRNEAVVSSRANNVSFTCWQLPTNVRKLQAVGSVCGETVPA